MGPTIQEGDSQAFLERALGLLGALVDGRSQQTLYIPLPVPVNSLLALLLI